MLNVALVLLPLGLADPPPVDPAVTPDVYGLELPCTDARELARFWSTALDFQIVSGPSAEGGAVLKNGNARLALRPTTTPHAPRGARRAYLNLAVGNLAVAGARVVQAGGSVDEQGVQPFALGTCQSATDPEGNPFDLLVLDGITAPASTEVFNIGIHARDLDEAEAFYTRLGFTVFSRDYLPDALPLDRSGCVALVIHPGERAADGAAGTLLLRVDDLDTAMTRLETYGIATSSRRITESPAGRSFAFTDPSGVALRIVERGFARVAFERLRGLAGNWHSASTRGWEGNSQFEPIARGSAVLERSTGAHAEETMLSVFHLDGARLLLTHYCVARNQPRLCLDPARSTASHLEFVFCDATNLPTTNNGHMHRAVFKLIDDDHFTSQWTWFQDGHESWNEEIEHARVHRTDPPPR